jgi:large subunit ribosomal protein L15
MLQLNNLESVSKKRKRVGRGGDLGGTSGRGHKGQGARSGCAISPSFEGGQMPLSRRLPKRGFNNRFKKEFQIINLNDLETKFSSGDVVNKETLREKGLVKGQGKFFIKVLGNGELTKNITIYADKFSKSAVDAIEKSGGKVELVKEN